MEEKEFRGEARTLGMPDTSRSHTPHTVHLVAREQVTMEGVLAVESFDDAEIILDTDLGQLTMKGEDLHIKQLDLDSGRFAVEGYVSALIYSAPRQRGGRSPKSRSFLERLLK